MNAKFKSDWYKKWFNEDYLSLYWEHNISEAEMQVEFLIKVLNLKNNERILDLGCGTGRHAIGFAKRGWPVLGVDISAVLIEKAKQEVSHYSALPVTFVKGDMRDLKNLGLFEVALSMFTSFGYFESDNENEFFLGTINQHLTQAGQFFLDYLHPHEVKKHLVPLEEKTINHEPVTILKEIHDHTIIKTITFPSRIYQERVKLYSRQEIEAMLKRQGFTILNVWNDYEGNPWKEDGERQLFHTQKQKMKP